MTTRTFTEQETALLHRIRETVHAIEPTAQVILYGSRARGDADPDSDWDLLVLLAGEVTNERERSVRYHLYDLERQTDTVLSTAVRSKEKWHSGHYAVIPFHRNVTREGISL
ncbi:MAG: nucleotidyltransferase domain-containing protein [Thermomicrobia bacterium]|nr:nucleotidyltransferase domain-containing protein [Thermomicrobia bacterium]MCA1723999.1 nucleotidyltransferase domain-containing protein [Thermomicrobia bacterium]